MNSQADQPPGGGEPTGPQPGEPPPPGGTPQPQAAQEPRTPPADAGTGPARPRVRPGRIWYLAPLAVLLGGVAWAVVGLISLSGQINSFPRAPMPAGGTVTLTQSGGYVIYYEGPGAASGHGPSCNVRIVSASASAAMAGIGPYTGTATYSFGSRQGTAVLTLQVMRPGRFLVGFSCASPVPGGSDLAFGHSISVGIVGIVLPSLALIFTGIAGVIVLFIIRLTRTRRARAQPVPPVVPPAG
jgi:hypothetical protein